MGMSTAERQRAYRHRHMKEGTDCRLSMVVDASSKAKIERLARHWGCSQREALAEALRGAEWDALEKMEGDEQKRYYDGG